MIYIVQFYDEGSSWFCDQYFDTVEEAAEFAEKEFKKLKKGYKDEEYLNYAIYEAQQV